MSANKDHIWITSRARMISERRYLSYDLAAHIAINTASVVLLLTSIYPNEIGSVIPGLSKINVASSLLLFAVSLLIYGFKFGEKAARYRECYLKLQRLLNRDMTDRELNEKYSDILDFYPNHAQRDYFDLIVDHYLIKKDAVKSPGSEEKIIPGCWSIFSYFSRRIIFYFLCYFIPFSAVSVSLLSLLVD